MHYFELTKVPQIADADSRLKLWLALFNAKTDEELNQIENLRKPVISQAIAKMREISAG